MKHRPNDLALAAANRHMAMRRWRRSTKRKLRAIAHNAKDVMTLNTIEPEPRMEERPRKNERRPWK